MIPGYLDYSRTPVIPAIKLPEILKSQTEQELGYPGNKPTMNRKRSDGAGIHDKNIINGSKK